MLVNIILSFRPKQWTKNFFIFGALVFTGNVFNLPLFTKTLLGFLIFCLLSGALYTINDIIDKEKDKYHSVKKLRPIASGRLNPTFAFIFALITITLCLFYSFILNFNFFICALSYLVLMLFYSILLKKIVIVDVLTISFGFVLRVIAGIEIIEAVISPWIILCTALLALFLGFSKRKAEIILYKEESILSRSVLEKYKINFLEQIIPIVSSATIVTYSLYTIESKTAENHPYLILTIPFVVYGIFRYLYITSKGYGEEPEGILLTDKPLIINIILWFCMVLFSFIIKS